MPPLRPLLSAAFAALALALGAPPAVAGPAGQICEVDAADTASAAWIRLQRVVERVAQRCQGGDVMKLHAFDEGHATDVAYLAPLICRFDAQILLIDGSGGARRLVCVYTGRARDVR
ncbi:MAG: hypothetical protein K2X74_20865 [Acetobacteraceae bacterium]|nr:hypothetical protein [Acetobacteraceae bacterium]